MRPPVGRAQDGDAAGGAHGAPAVLVCSLDRTLSELLAWNLASRGYRVRHEAWDPCGGAAPARQDGADVLVADLDFPGPGCWAGLARVREAFPSVPLPLLQPCAHLRKPFGAEELLTLVQAVAAGSRKSPQR
jgi:hypothetical protein